MSLERLAVEDFRCIERAELELDLRCNLISGENASGKTSLLEALFFLGRGRSFRTARNEALIRTGRDRLLVTGRLADTTGRHAIGMRFGREGMEARFGGRAVQGLAELAQRLPVQAIDPEVHRLVEGGPQERRRFLDWGVFHVEPRFVDHWRRYQRALRQRNAALRAGESPSAIRAWDPELVETGEVVAEHRSCYLVSLAPAVREAGRRLLGADLDIGLLRGWPADVSLGECLDQSFERDVRRGMTHAGPHRADLSVRFAGQVARDRVSRGQQKLAASALLLGQLRCDAELGSRVAVLLVDDPAAELDSGSLSRLMAEVLDLPSQLVITALDSGHPVLQGLPAGGRFHVEHGAVTRLI
jgi:DNA replication and repair protein RecF